MPTLTVCPISEPYPRVECEVAPPRSPPLADPQGEADSPCSYKARDRLSP